MRIFILIFVLLQTTLLFAQSSKVNSDTTVNSVNNTYEKFRFGGYGELLYQHMDYGADRYNNVDGSQSDNRSYVDMPRLVFEFNYKFRSDIEFVTEVEFEYGGTGSALELEYEEMGEYEMEMEKGGEVILEQFFIKKRFTRAFNVKVGHFVVPIGITNTNHLPSQFFGTVRSEGESTIVPLTWHETGLAILGDYRRWSYEVQIINGLDANGFSSAYWVSTGKQGIFETTKITDPAYTVSIQNRSINNLTLAAALYYGNSAANTAKPSKMEHIDGRVAIGSCNFEYNNKKLIARGNFIYGDLSDSDEISNINKNISSNIQYARTPVAKNAMTYSLELGYDVLSLFKSKSKLFPFVRYEYYNSMQGTEELVFLDARYKRQVITAGLNYSIMDGLVIKADYSHRVLDGGNYNNENTFALAVVFNTWYITK